MIWTPLRRHPSRPVLLITPKGQAWLPAPPKNPRQPVIIALDVIEEIWRSIETPVLSPRDRQAYLQTQIALETSTNPNQLWASWVSSRAPWWRSVSAAVCLIASPLVQQTIEDLLRQRWPIVGVWSLTASLLRLAWRLLPNDGGYHAVIYRADHGARLLLLRGRQPLYTRLIPVDAPGQVVGELATTLGFLRDQGIVPRSQSLQVHLLGRHDALQEMAGTAASRWRVHDDAVAELTDLLARMRPGLPLQLATAEQRRYYLAYRSRQLGHAVGSLASIAVTGSLIMQWEALAQIRAEQSTVEQAIATEQAAIDALHEDLQRTGVDLAVLRQALALPHLRAGAEPGDAALSRAISSTQRWLADAPAELVVQQWRWQDRQLCRRPSERLSQGAAPGEDASAPGQDSARASVAFEVELTRIERPSERERWVERMENRLRADSEWEVVESPWAARGQRALRVVGAGGANTESKDSAAWCLARRAAPLAAGHTPTITPPSRPGD